MKIIAYICSVLLAITFLWRALMLSFICVCGSCGWIFNPWAVVFVLLAASNLWAVVLLWQHSSKSLRRSRVIALITLLFMIWGTGLYVFAIFSGADYFDLILFIPIILAFVSNFTLWVVSRSAKLEAHDIA